MYVISPLKYALEFIVIPIVAGFIISGIFAIVVRLISKEPGFLKTWFYYAGFGSIVGLISFGTGILTGLSRAPASGNVLPAVLALIAGLNIYVFGTDSKYKIVVGYCIFVLMFMLIFGIETGSFQREQQHESRLKELSQQEFRVRALRQNLDLPQEMPSWILGTGSD
jgi:hypothetical protein